MQYTVFKREDFSPLNIKKTLSVIFDKTVNKCFNYAVLYSEQREEKVETHTERYGTPVTIREDEVNEYGCEDYYEDVYDALYRWRQIPQIANKKYNRIAVISRQGKIVTDNFCID